MFTGIIEELGQVIGLSGASGIKQLAVQAEIFGQAKVGDSISINGACLTITELKGKEAKFDVSRETLEKTCLGKLKKTNKVNLEMALKADSRLGGHFVTGHVDCAGKILNKPTQDKNWTFEIGFDPEYKKYIVKKGSITVDGISLTVGEVKDKSFLVYIIPHTAKMTTLGFKQIGDLVNIEVDVLGKYVESVLGKHNNETRVTEAFLKEHGFLF